MESRLREVLRAREGAMIGLLRELVEQGSYTGDRAGGEAVAAILERELGTIEGLSVSSRGSARFARTVVARSARAEATAASAVGLVGHLDTVFPPGTFEGFRVEEGVARGPGVLDMKGGLVVMLESLRALATLGALPHVAVRLVVVGDEEVGSPESFAWLCEELAGASAALVFESGRAADRIITARKGTGSATVTATGRAAHAGNAHHEGANAIWALARFVERAQSLTDYDRGVTVNVGTIRGGESKNTVPDHAEARLDYRFLRDADREATVAALGRCAAEAAASLPGTTVTLSGLLARPPLERTDANVALYREYAACAREAGLGDGEAPVVGGGSDASTTASVGVPSIDGLGPRGTGFHTKEERVELATLAPKAEAVARFLLRRAGVG